ncbi:MAG TPA: FAD-binding oxidoreductase [Methylovirgula sp.]|nr:FAD-binding oxidoreductase [Methylovirgula sp.]
MGPKNEAVKLAIDVPARLAAILGRENVIADPAEMRSYLMEPRGLFKGMARCIALPASTEEVAAAVALCAESGTKIVPQGGNTGLVGGQTPSEHGDEIILSLRRMDKVREVDLASNTLTVEAGMTLARVQTEAEKAGRLFPLSLPAATACTIGGNLATNAGGAAAIAYGTARDLTLGLEVVLADGRILSDLSKLKKNNTGYDLKDLFIGCEGTLGIITAAVLKLYPRPQALETAFIGIDDPQAALRFLDFTRETFDYELKTFELIPRIAMEFVLKHGNSVREPLPTPAPVYVLLELAGQSADVRERLCAFLRVAEERGMMRAAIIAALPDERALFWRIRSQIPDVQAQEGGSIKHDISVPIAEVPAFLDEVERAVGMRVPGARLVAFGHLGDGNIHCNVSQPVGADRAAFLARWDEINEIVHAIVAKHGGAISAEHGIGQLKRALLPKAKDPVALDVMRALKRTLDPQGILNPGKVI